MATIVVTSGSLFCQAMLAEESGVPFQEFGKRLMGPGVDPNWKSYQDVYDYASKMWNDEQKAGWSNVPIIGE